MTTLFLPTGHLLRVWFTLSPCPARSVLELQPNQIRNWPTIGVVFEFRKFNRSLICGQLMKILKYRILTRFWTTRIAPMRWEAKLFEGSSSWLTSLFTAFLCGWVRVSTLGINLIPWYDNTFCAPTQERLPNYNLLVLVDPPRRLAWEWDGLQKLHYQRILTQNLRPFRLTGSGLDVSESTIGSVYGVDALKRPLDMAKIGSRNSRCVCELGLFLNPLVQGVYWAIQCCRPRFVQ
jgi:hypothetical protein